LGLSRRLPRGVRRARAFPPSRTRPGRRLAPPPTKNISPVENPSGSSIRSPKLPRRCSPAASLVPCLRDTNPSGSSTRYTTDQKHFPRRESMHFPHREPVRVVDSLLQVPRRCSLAASLGPCLRDTLGRKRRLPPRLTSQGN